MKAADKFRQAADAIRNDRPMAEVISLFRAGRILFRKEFQCRETAFKHRVSRKPNRIG
jgi:hypothetical protein